MILEYSITQLEFKQIKDFVYQKVGINLTEQKKQLIITRLSKRLRHFKYDTFSEYIEHLIHKDPLGSELEQMINQISTNKTHFFRENIHFDFLREVILPSYKESLFLWCAAASTGEEPYSLAIALKEFYSNRPKMRFKFIASDVDTEVLKKAKNGIYETSKINDLDKSLLHKHFLKGEGSSSNYVKVKPYLQKIIDFRRINLVSFPYPLQKNSIDVVFMRNVLIYFDNQTKQNIVDELRKVVKPGGFIVFGISDAVQSQTKDLKYIKNSVYQVI